VQRAEVAYLASPFTHSDHQIQMARFHAISWVAHWLHRQRRFVYSPIVHNIPLGDLGVGHTWDLWQYFDLSMVSRCDRLIVAQLPGWEQSIGVKAEIEAAQAWNIPVEMLVPPWEEMEKALGDLRQLRRVA
jgi:Domain of unknown function (DUF1937)